MTAMKLLNFVRYFI